MKLLAIETSCDETAVALLECESTGEGNAARFAVLGNALLSQIELHAQYGGVYPMMAKREHAKNLVPLLEAALAEAQMLREDTQSMPEVVHEAIATVLEREPGLTELFFASVLEMETPDIDTIAVTAGPGLEPALWVGVNFAKALALAWNKPLIAVNHLEGHIVSAIAKDEDGDLFVEEPRLPLLALGIAGGHTDLVLMSDWLSYATIGGTLDDSVGEAFDKVARMLGLPYPGGPEISRLAEVARGRGGENPYTLPRPMIKSGTNDFSFSGLKTAVLYLLKKNPDISQTDKEYMALEFEDAAADVLWSKTDAALRETGAKTLVVSGGVSANLHIRRVFEEKIKDEHPDVALRIPPFNLATDNAVMIGLAGYFHALRKEFADPQELRADGNLRLMNRGF
ncbi:MAG: tRNA (adenosine(37)-N6)-threonylcarbamoyltransferase complex transferase subunit TsaD [Patescibacteria group bacterium]